MCFKLFSKLYKTLVIIVKPSIFLLFMLLSCLMMIFNHPRKLIFFYLHFVFVKVFLELVDVFNCFPFVHQCEFFLKGCRSLIVHQILQQSPINYLKKYSQHLVVFLVPSYLFAFITNVILTSIEFHTLVPFTILHNSFPQNMVFILIFPHGESFTIGLFNILSSLAWSTKFPFFLLEIDFAFFLNYNIIFFFFILITVFIKDNS